MFASNKGADQPAHARSLISAFVVRLMERIISKLATSDIYFFFYLVNVDEGTCLNLILSETRLCRVEAKTIPLLSLQSFNFIQTFIHAFGIVMFEF